MGKFEITTESGKKFIIETEAKAPVKQQAPQKQQVPGGALTRGAAGVGEFFGLGPLGRGLGQAAFQFTPEAKRLEQDVSAGRVSPDEFEQISTGGIKPQQVVGSALATALLGTAPGIRAPAGLGAKALQGAGLTGATSAAISAARGAPETEQAKSLITGAAIGGAFPFVIAGGKKAINFAGRQLGNLLGISTGTSGQTVQQVRAIGAKGGTAQQTFKQGLRGKITGKEILDEAESAVRTVRSQRGQVYQQQLAQVRQAKPLDLTRIKATAINDLKSFGVKRTGVGGRTLDFSQSKIADKAQQRLVAESFDDIMGWSNSTPVGVDTLKVRLDDRLSDAVTSKQADAYISGLKNTVKKELVDNVSGYEKMIADYSKASELLVQTRRGLGVGGKSTETAIKKLATALKDNNEFRAQLLSQLQGAAGRDISSQIAGQQLSSALPRGLARVLFGPAVSGGVFGAAVNPAAIPAILTALLAGSPRLVGEAALKTGAAQRVAGPAASGLGKILTSPSVIGALTSRGPSSRK